MKTERAIVLLLPALRLMPARLRLIAAVGANPLVGDVINAEQLNRMLQRAAEVADAG
jgi:hypothetical protein